MLWSRPGGLSVHTRLLTSARDAKVRPFSLAALYDHLRLSIYQRRGPRGHQIRIGAIGQSTLLRFDDVGYFNAVYAAGDNVSEQFDHIERFFEGSPHGCRLISPTLGDNGPLAEVCRRRGWTPDTSIAWVSGTPRRLVRTHAATLTVRVARRDEARLFAQTYLEAFEAAPNRMSAGIDNMQYLFEEPALHFLFAVASDRPAGVGMLLQVGDEAMLCAGAMLPSHRGLGGHEALLVARLDLAARLGCTTVHSWSVRGGRSHCNLERVGLSTVADTRTWRWGPRSAA